MMTLVRLIDLGVEYIKLLLGVNGGPVARILAWISFLALIAVAVALITWGVRSIPTFVDYLNE